MRQRLPYSYTPGLRENRFAEELAAINKADEILAIALNSLRGLRGVSDEVGAVSDRIAALEDQHSETARYRELLIEEYGEAAE